jgi:hypothetical protein
MCIRVAYPQNIRTGRDSHFGAGREIEITLEKPYRKDPPPKLNRLGIPEKNRYRTADVCTVLKISPDLFRWRILRGKYPEAKRDATGRLFTLADIERLVEHKPQLDQRRVEAVRKRWKKNNQY